MAYGLRCERVVKEMECYLDNSATTKVMAGAAEAVLRLMTEDYGNPSSMHRRGFEAEKEIKNACDVFSKIYKCTADEIIFTSGGTESNNMAIFGAASSRQRYGKHLITTCIEHASVLQPMKALEERGYEVTYLSVDKRGIISLEELRKAIREDTILVSIMHVNNEIGSVQPIAEIGAIIKEMNPKCLFHVDDIQGFAKLRLLPRQMKIDMISISGHKIHGPKGTGVLYKSKDVRIDPLIYGGGQQKGMRSGTENTAGIVGLSVAADEMNRNLAANSHAMYEKRAHFVRRLSEIPGVIVNGPAGFEYYNNSDFKDENDNSSDLFAPHIISLSIEDIRAEVILHALEDKGIYVSAGSACSSNKPAVSATLKAIGLDNSLLDSTIRLSMSADTTIEKTDYAADVLLELLPQLRRFVRK